MGILSDTIAKKAADGEVSVENEPAESVKAAPAETPTKGSASADLPTEPTPATQQTKFITDVVEQMLCQQIGNELFAFYEYTAVCAWAKGQGFDGFGAWAAFQAGHEQEHMQRILDFLVELGCTPDLPQITGVSVSFPSIKEAVKGVFEREKAVTKNWRIIAKQAMADADAATLDLAQWFVREQMEEEDLAKKVLAKLAAAGTGTGILVLDGQLLSEYSKSVD